MTARRQDEGPEGLPVRWLLIIAVGVALAAVTMANPAWGIGITIFIAVVGLLHMIVK